MPFFVPNSSRFLAEIHVVTGCQSVRSTIFIFYDDGSTYASFYRTICTSHMLYVDVLMCLFSTPIGYFANPLSDLCISSAIKNAGAFNKVSF